MMDILEITCLLLLSTAFISGMRTLYVCRDTFIDFTARDVFNATCAFLGNNHKDCDRVWWFILITCTSTLVLWDIQLRIEDIYLMEESTLVEIIWHSAHALTTFYLHTGVRKFHRVCQGDPL